MSLFALCKFSLLFDHRISVKLFIYMTVCVCEWVFNRTHSFISFNGLEFKVFHFVGI